MRLMCVHKLSLLLLLLLAGWSGGYEVTEMVEGRLEAESVNHYTIDTTGILIGSALQHYLVHVSLSLSLPLSLSIRAQWLY